MTIVSASKKITISPSAEGTEIIYRVPPAKVLKLRRVLFIFPTGVGHQVGLAIMKFIKQVCPTQGLVFGDNAVIELSDDTEYTSGEHVEVYYKNYDSTNSYEVVVIVEGELT